MKRINIAKIMSVIATGLCVYACYHMFFETANEAAAIGCMFFGIFLGLVSYCFCGLVNAIVTPFSLAKWGFFFGPFPMNLVNVVALFIFGIFAVLVLPAYPVFRRARELGY